MSTLELPKASPEGIFGNKTPKNLPAGWEKGASVGCSRKEILDANSHFHDGSPPESDPKMHVLEKVETTKYYTPVYSGNVDKKTLQMEGAGILVGKNGMATILDYHGQSKPMSPGNMRGKSAMGNTTLTTYRTIAVDTSKIPLGSWVYVDFGKNMYTGWYRAEDVGGRIQGNHIDIFSGVGRDNYTFGKKNIPDMASRIVWFDDRKIHTKQEEEKKKTQNDLRDLKRKVDTNK